VDPNIGLAVVSKIEIPASASSRQSVASYPGVVCIPLHIIHIISAMNVCETNLFN